MSDMTAPTANSIVRDDPSTYPEWFRTNKPRSNLIVARWVPILLVGLPVLVLFGIVVYPTVWMFYHSVHDTNMMRLFQGNWSYIGFENFATASGTRPCTWCNT